MKVIFVNRFYWPDQSATSQLLSDLTRDLALAGLQIVVVTSRVSRRSAVAGSAAEMIDGVRVERICSTSVGRVSLLGRLTDYLTFYVGATWRLWRVARANDVIVAKTDPPLMGVPCALVARLRHARLVNWLQDVFPEIAEMLRVPGMRGPAAALLKRLRDWSLASASFNVVLGERMARLSIRKGAAPANVVVLPNWADGTVIVPKEPSAVHLRTAWNLGEGLVVAYAGNLGRVHDFETILGAADALRGGPVQFLVVGGGAQRKWLQREVRKRGLRNIVLKTHQPRETLCDVLAVADVHLVSLRPEMEGLVVPSKVYGIMAAGRPGIFVGALDGEVATLFQQGGCGLAVAQGDSEALAKAILEMAVNGELRADMGRRARALFDQQFDRKVIAAEWLKLICRISAVAEA